MKTKQIILLVLLTLLLSSGCWSRLELEERSIVAGLGVDEAPGGKVRVSLQVIRPGGGTEQGGMMGTGGGGRGPKRVIVYSGTGYTVSDAIEAIDMKDGKRAFLTEERIVVISQELSGHNLYKVLDFLERSREPSTRTPLVVAKGDAIEILKAESPLEDIWAYGIAQTVDVGTRHGHLPGTEISEFIVMLESKTRAPVASGLRLVKKEENPEQGGQGQEMKEPREEVIAAGSAVFKNLHLIGWLNEIETKGMKWVTGQITEGVTELQFQGRGQEDQRVVMKTERSKGEIKPEIKNGKLFIEFDIKEDCEIVEFNIKDMELTKSETIDFLRSLKHEQIKKEVSLALRRSQELNADVFGIGEAVRRKYPGEWKRMEGQWDEIYPNLDVNIKVVSQILHSIKTTNPPRDRL